MRISSVQAHLLSYPMPEPVKLACYGGQRTIVKRDAMLIRIQADNGLTGYAPGEPSEQAKRDIESVIAPFLEGRILADPDALRVHFLEGGRDTDLQRLYGAVEIALYDLAGKAKGVSISELLGGRVRDRIRLYASAGVHGTPEKYVEEAHVISQLGFRAYKLLSGRSLEQDLAAVRQIREAVGPDFELIVDAHACWIIGDRSDWPCAASKLVEALGPHNIAWMEEPLPPDDREGYRRLKALDLVPIAAGGHEPDETRYLDLILSASVDYALMDVALQGGYHTARRLLAEISPAGLKVALQSSGTALDVIAAAQLGICWPEQVVEWLEYPCYPTASRDGVHPFPLATGILREPLAMDGGDLVLPQAPGLGVAIDETVLERYPWIPGFSSSFNAALPRGVQTAQADPVQPRPGETPSQAGRSS